MSDNSDEVEDVSGEVTICEFHGDGSEEISYTYRARCLVEGKTLGNFTYYRDAEATAKRHRDESGHNTSVVSLPR